MRVNAFDDSLIELSVCEEQKRRLQSNSRTGKEKIGAAVYKSLLIHKGM